MAFRASAFILAGVCVTGACMAAQAPAPVPPIRNFVRVNDQFCTGGQPRMEHFAQLKAEGVKAVINLRTPGEHRAAEGTGDRVADRERNRERQDDGERKQARDDAQAAVGEGQGQRQADPAAPDDGDIELHVSLPEEASRRGGAHAGGPPTGG